MRNSKCSIVMYHYVREIEKSRYPQIKGLEFNDFKKQIGFLKQMYTFVSAEDIYEALESGKTLPDNAVLLTFDDGYLDHYTNVFPLLRQEKIPAFFSMPGKIIREKKLLDVNKIHYILASTDIKTIIANIYSRLDYYRGEEFEIPSNEKLFEKLANESRFDSKEVIFVKRLLQVELDERLRNMITSDLFQKCVGVSEEVMVNELYMNIEQVKFMSKNNMSFGIHGYDHYWMNRLDEESLRMDIENALEVFDGIVPSKNWVCCYPYGSYDDKVISTVKALGAGWGIGTAVGVAHLGEEFRYKLPRLDTNDFPPKSENYKTVE